MIPFFIVDDLFDINIRSLLIEGMKYDFSLERGKMGV